MTDTSQETMWQFIEGLPVLRAFAGWSVKELADQLGITRATLTKIESLEEPVKPVYYLAIRKLFEDKAQEEGACGDVTLTLVLHIMDGKSPLMTRDELWSYYSIILAKTGYKRGMKHIKLVLRKEFRKWTAMEKEGL